MRCDKRFPGAAEASALDLLDSTLGREFPVTRLLVFMCCVVFLFQTLDAGDLLIWGKMSLKSVMGVTEESRPPIWTYLRWGATSARLSAAEPFRLVSANFVHFGAIHLVLNMMGLVNLGRLLEPRVGTVRLLAIAVVTGVAGFAVSLGWDAWYSHQNAATAGASALILGLAGTLVGALYGTRDPEWKRVATNTILYAVLFGVSFPVNNAAHAGGFLAGVPLGYLVARERRRWNLTPWFRALAVIGAVASVSSVVLCHTSDVWRAQLAREQARRHISF